MSDHLDLGMPKDFPKRIHQALRTWHALDAKDALTDLLLAYKIKAEREAATPRLISNRVLIKGLDGLQQTNPKLAELLQRRFPNQETALAVAHKLNVSEDVVFQRQRAAIAQLADIIWGREVQLRQQQLLRIEARLEAPTYSQLFGVTDKLAQVRAQLESDSEPWILAFEGLGGIGKTSLADALARELARRINFYEIGWVSARRRLFRLSGQIETLDDSPDLTLTELVDCLIDQFDLTGLRRQSDAHKLVSMRDFLKSQSCLVIVDNLETTADYSALVSQLRGLVNPSKFLITTRYSLGDVSGVFVLTLRQLSQEDTLALVRHEAKTRGLHELADAPEADLAPIYDVTGGNPLATKLLVGQIHTLSLPIALARFSAVKGQPVEELLDFIYAHAWEGLDVDSHRVLQAMLLVTEEGGQLEQIAAAASLDLDAAATCLQRLATLSLVNVGGDLWARRYSLHQLTQTFLTQRTADH
jgi:DNA polymerase III delta prime subunit